VCTRIEAQLAEIRVLLLLGQIIRERRREFHILPAAHAVQFRRLFCCQFFATPHMHTAARVLSPRGDTCKSRAQPDEKTQNKVLKTKNFHQEMFFDPENHFPPTNIEKNISYFVFFANSCTSGDRRIYDAGCVYMRRKR
jgi:hypothetical protein